MGYLTNFIVYVFAMVGVMMLALLVFKHSAGIKTKVSGSKNLKIIDTLSLGARKNLYIISAGNEKFLIAGDVDRTSLISKLDSHSEYNLEQCAKNNILKRNEENSVYTDKSVLGIKSMQTSAYEPVMKSLAEKIRG